MSSKITQATPSIIGIGSAVYLASNSQRSDWSSNTSVRSNVGNVIHNAYNGKIKLVASVAGTGERTVKVAVVSKVTAALKNLTGKNTESIQQNLTLIGNKGEGFLSLMAADANIKNFPAVVVSALKKIVTTLETNPDDVSVTFGAVTAATDELEPLVGAKAALAWDIRTGQSAVIFYK
jgi:hypothetical protein